MKKRSRRAACPAAKTAKAATRRNGGNQQKKSSAALNSTATAAASDDYPFTPTTTFEEVRADLQQFATERDWAQYHTPRNLALALVGEVGEVAELFQWLPDAQCMVGLPSWDAEKREALADELSDVLTYLLRLATVCHVDLPTAVRRKLEKNRAKYPADLVRGSAKKYNEYKAAARAAAGLHS